VNYKLPSISSDRRGFEALAGLAHASRELMFDGLEVDFSDCSFFAANMAAVLGALLSRVELEFNSVSLVNFSPKVKSILCRNDFLTHFRYEPEEDENDTTMPYRRIQLDDQTRFDGYLRRHLRGKGIPTMTEALASVFKRKLYEVFENAVIHSKSEVGVCCCGQFFPNEKRLDITIADGGVGIRQNVRRHLQNPKLSSVDAMRWAMEEGHSTKSGTQPGGLGLKFLKDFVTKNKGRIKIASRFGFYEFANGRESFTKMTDDLPGTAVTITINTADTATYRLASEVSVDDIF
jgi:anti-sigma regulatory factor (Ser/Thr protein kinase)/anti-anti-sigma regulatory factor